MGKLTVVKIRYLTEAGRYADGDGPYLDVADVSASVGFFAFRRMGGAGKSVSGR